MQWIECTPGRRVFWEHWHGMKFQGTHHGVISRRLPNGMIVIKWDDGRPSRPIRPEYVGLGGLPAPMSTFQR